jgi:uncharacterized protein YggE
MLTKFNSFFGVAALLVLFSLQSFAEKITVRGSLAHTVEPGGWIINTDKEKYLLLNARRFESNAWFREGARVEATGETRPDVVTTFMEGVPFEADSLSPIQNTQTVTKPGDGRNLTRVLVTGDAVVKAQPDTAVLNISVVTQDKRAVAAQEENAARSDAVIRALKAAAGAGAEVKTSGYVVEPQRIYKEAQPPTIIGYEARNSVIVTLKDLTKVGAVIDAASAAGANNIESVTFTLRNTEAAKTQALTNAIRVAKAKAQAVAEALGGRVARISQVQEQGFIRPPQPLDEFGAQTRMAGKPTPIEVGTLDVNSQVQLVAEIEANN